MINLKTSKQKHHRKVYFQSSNFTGKVYLCLLISKEKCIFATTET